MKQHIQRTAEKVLGRKTTKKKTKEWYDKDCEKPRKLKNEARIKWIDTSREQDRREYEIKRNNANILYRRKKNAWLNNKLEEIERDSNNHNIKQFYRKIKNQTNKPRTRTRGLKNNESQIEYEPQKIGNI